MGQVLRSKEVIGRAEADARVGAGVSVGAEAGGEAGTGAGARHREKLVENAASLRAIELVLWVLDVSPRVGSDFFIKLGA